MDYVSTRNAGLRVSAAKAIATGIAPDGGLFCPTEFPALDETELQEFSQAADTIRRLLDKVKN